MMHHLHLVTVLLLSSVTFTVSLTREEIVAKVKTFLGDKFLDLINSPEIEVTYEDNRIVVQVAEDYELPVLELFKIAIPTFARSLTEVQFFEDAASNPLNFHVDRFVVDIAKEEFSLSTRESAQDIEVIPEFLELSSAKAQISVSINTDQGVALVNRLSLTGIGVSGTWRVGTTEIDFELTKAGNDFTLSGAPGSGTISVKQFIDMLGLSLLPTGRLGDGLKKAGLDRFSLQGVKAVVHSTEKGYAVALSGQPTISGWGSFKMHVMHHQYEGTREGVVTIATVFDSFKLSDLIKRLTGIDMSNVPVLGSITIPKIGLVISTGDVNPNLVPDVIGKDSVLTHALPFPGGVSVVAEITLKRGQAPILFLIRLTKDSATFEKIDKSGSLTLGVVVDILTPGVNIASLSLPPGVRNILAVPVTEFSYDHSKRQLAVTLELGGTLEIIPNLLRVDNPKLAINSTLTSAGTTTVEGSGLWSVGPASFPLYIHPVTKNGQKGFLIKGKGKELRVGEIVSKFNSQFLPGPLSSLLDRAGLRDFKIRNPMVQVPIGAGAQGQQLFLSGEPVIGDFSGVTVNVAAVKQSGGVSMALGLDFANTNFAGLVKKITGKSIKGLAMFDKSLKIGVIVSKSTLPGVKFQGPTLSQLEIKKGITVAALFQFPDNCGSDKICAFCKGALGADASMRLRTVIESPSQFMVAAGVANIKLGSSLVLNSVELQLEIGEETTFGLAGSLRLRNPPLTFNGAIRFAPAELQLEMSMVGIWKRAFGINFLAVGNLQLEIGVLLVYPPVLSLLKFGGEVRVGKLDTGRELIAKAYIGLDINTPKNNYFYGSISSASIPGIMRAFDMRASLPRVLAESGFPRGLSASYSIKSVEVPGLTIPAGFRLSGTMNILGFTASAVIKLNPPKSVLFDMRLSKLDIGRGAIRVCASKSDCSTGPVLYANIVTSPPSVSVRIQGYATLFNILNREIIIYVTNEKIIFSVTGPLFLFEATLRVTANYGSLQAASFRVYAELSTAWMTELKNRVTAIIKSGADAATRKISDAQRKIDSAQGAYDNAIRVLQQKQRSVDSAQGAYDRAVNSLRAKQRNVNSLCSKRTCSRNCIGCPKWNGCCKRVWGACIGCPGWNGCCTRITDPICAAANLACEALRKVAYAALWAAEKVVDNNRWPLNVAKAALKAAAVIVDKNRWPLNAAKGVLEGIKRAVKFGADAANAIVRFALGGLINIRKITFDVQISAVQSGHFRGSIEVSFLKGPVKRLSFDLRLKSVVAMAKDLADSIFPGITGRRRRSVDEQLKLALPDFSRKHYFPQESIYRPGAAKREAPYEQVKSSAELLSEFAKRSAEEFADLEEQGDLEGDDEGPNPLDEIDDAEVPRAADATEAEKEAEELKRVGETEPDLPDDDAQEDIDEKELAIDEIDKTPASTEEKCDHSNKLLKPLDDLLSLLRDVVASWRTAAVEYTKANAKNSLPSQLENIRSMKSVADSEHSDILKKLRVLAKDKTRKADLMPRKDLLALKTNLTGEQQEMAAIDKLSEAMSAQNKSARDHIVKQNKDGLSRILYKELDPAVRRKTGMGLRTYVNKLLQSLAEPYEEEEFENPKAEEEVRLIQDLREVMDKLFSGDMTLFKLEAEAKQMSDDLARMKKIYVFCPKE